MSMFSGITNRLSGLSFTSAVAYMGGQQGAQWAYMFGPALIRSSVISAAQRQFGFYAGTIIGNAAAPAAITAAMPTLITQATVAGAFLAVASINTISSVYNYAIHAKNNRNYQNECRAVVPTCEKLLVTNSLNGNEDFEEVTMQPDMQGAAAAA